MELLAGQFSSAKVKTRLDRAEGLPRVAGDADRLQQVMINLLLNAVQAMPDGGALVVETRSVRRTRPGLEDSAEQGFVSFSVKDTGVGIPTTSATRSSTRSTPPRKAKAAQDSVSPCAPASSRSTTAGLTSRRPRRRHRV